MKAERLCRLCRFPTVTVRKSIDLLSVLAECMRNHEVEWYHVFCVSIVSTIEAFSNANETRVIVLLNE